MSEKKTFYVTTPIYYVNDVPHIGHAYTTVAADCIARYKRLKGYKVLFLTGADEHGQKVEKAAAASGVKPIEFADRVVARFKDLWKKLDISNNDFIRTTEERHKKAVIHLWEEVSKRGDIYLGEYEDWYCTSCENFLTETQLAGCKCPDCGRPVEKLKEPSYFFKLSKYGKPLLEHIEKNPGFIQPEHKKNEVVSFLKEGLRDLSLSRTTFSWGIPVPGDARHIMYVWFDALTNYLTVTGYPDNPDGFWPADLHLIGKDILRFHAVYWPAFLMSAGVDLPKRMFAHGWWTMEGAKMSKSRGNVIDPYKVIEDYGADQFRFFLLREMPFGADGDFSLKAFTERVNSELANNLGNLLNRSISMIEKYRGGVVPEPDESKDRSEAGLENEVKKIFELTLKKHFDRLMNDLKFYNALEQVWVAVGNMNLYVDRSAPWKEKDEAVLSNILYNLAEGLRIIAVYVYPFIPASAERIWGQLGIDRTIGEVKDFDREVTWCGSLSGIKIKKGPSLFPRMENKPVKEV